MISIQKKICEICNRTFISKWHLSRHQKRKVPCKAKPNKELLREECDSPRLTIHGDLDDL